MSSGTPAIASAATIASAPVNGMKRAEPAELAHVAGAGLVVDDAGGHEQRGLEGRVVDDVEYGGHRGQRLFRPSSMVIRPRWQMVE